MLIKFHLLCKNFGSFSKFLGINFQWPVNFGVLFSQKFINSRV